MGQGGVISGFLLAAFVIYITQRGELPAYMGYLFGASKAAAPASPAALPAMSEVLKDAFLAYGL